MENEYERIKYIYGMCCNTSGNENYILDGNAK